jgi:hypothetical protein
LGRRQAIGRLAQRRRWRRDGTVGAYEMTALDTDGQPLGRPSIETLPALLARRVNAQPDETWVVTGTLIAEPIYSERRFDQGTFNHPPFVGPYIEFDYELQMRGLKLAEDAVAKSGDAGGI